MRIPLDRRSAAPLYVQIRQFLRAQIESGALGTGTRLPGTRELAEELGVSRIVVTNAYADLEAAGVLRGKQGDGTYVISSPPARIGLDDTAISGEDWPLWQQQTITEGWTVARPELSELQRHAGRADMINFAFKATASDIAPVEDFRKAIHRVLRRDGIAAMGEGSDPAGFPPLRAVVAQILSNEGIPTAAENVLITSGSQQALNLVARLLLRPGDVALVESPTYHIAINLFRSLGVRMFGVPMDGEGMQVDKVEDALQSLHPRLIYTMPTFHNPTGICMSTERRRQLVAVAGRYSTPILEDDFAGSYRYGGVAAPAIKALDPGGGVIYAGSFSKTLMEGLRLGFLVVEGPVWRRLQAAKYVSDLATSELIQRAVHEFITVGRYQVYLRRACREYRRRRDTMLAALAREMPAGTRWVPPSGGLHIWVQFPNGISSQELAGVAAEKGVLFMPGAFFFPGEGPQAYGRLGFAYNPCEAIGEGIERLRRALDTMLGGA